MFTLSEETLAIEVLRRELAHDSAGACVSFEGLVRNINENRKVIALEYESYENLALTEGSKILLEAIERFDLLLAKCQHRTGKLSIGETAVWIGVVAGHRNPAFAASRYIIDEIKKRVPIWKKEFYEDGTSDWIRNAG